MATYTLRLNGRTHQVEGDSADSLLSILRYELGLTGSKFGCGEGHCGACTVMIDDQATRSCVARLGAVSGKNITTVEGLASGDKLHPVQEAFIEAEAFQCGYCTPGMVMATIGLLKTNPSPTEQDIARVLDRNVCRCGTYPRIVKAIQSAATKTSQASERSEPRSVRSQARGGGATPRGSERGEPRSVVTSAWGWGDTARERA